MLDNPESFSWPALARPYGQAERALGRLAHGLENTPYHGAWLWREITRSAVTVVQAGGHHAKVDQLRLTLIGMSIEREENNSGLAAAKRVFLAGAPLFRERPQTDSNTPIWPSFWENGDHDGQEDVEGEGIRVRRQLLGLARDLASFADDGRRPALINLLIDFRQHAATKTLPVHSLRLALPLALVEAGVIPKAAPGLLGGRRLPLGMSRAVTEVKPLTEWLVQCLGELATEAEQSYQRLAELTRQHRAWRQGLVEKGFRRDALAPRALDLLAATPVFSIGLVARHLGCSHVAAGKIIERLVGLGILIEQTSRSRHKLFVAGDLPAEGRHGTDRDEPLALSQDVPDVDVDAISATLDGLLADLDLQSERIKETLATGEEKAPRSV